MLKNISFVFLTLPISICFETKIKLKINKFNFFQIFFQKKKINKICSTLTKKILIIIQ